MRALVLVSVLGFASTALAQDPSASADEARRLSRAGDAAGALRAMLRAVEQQPDDPVFHCEAGWLAFLAEDLDVATEQLALGLARYGRPLPRRAASCLYNAGRVAEAGGRIEDARARYRESLALRPNDVVRARLDGLAAAGARPAPSAPSGADGPPTDGRLTLVAQDSHTCFIRDGELLCWGRRRIDDGGEVIARRATPTPGFDRRASVRAHARGIYFSCALDERGVVCWDHDLGLRRGASATGQRRPSVLPGFGDDLVELEASWFTLCARSASGSVRCRSQGAAAPSDPGARGVAQMAAGNDFVCFRGRDGRVQCLGAIGAPASGLHEVPFPARVAHIGADRETLCAALEDGRVFCVGVDRYGVAGSGTGRNPACVEGVCSAANPVRGIDDAVFVAVGNYTACAIRRDGELRCWGMNNRGQAGPDHDVRCGREHTRCRRSPGTIGGLGPVREVTIGNQHTCALERSGAVRCWGDNFRGQLGSGGPSTGVQTVLFPEDEGPGETGWGRR
ncbi:MAG: hypothetical protein H6719_12880 [Sandaracinaceae bacterium]|nr:hypothetical protein [Sandaracinaceae bacterium]